MELAQFRILYRKFLFRMIDLELISSHSDMSKLLGQFAALLIFLSLIFMILPAWSRGPQSAGYMTFAWSLEIL